MAGGQWSVIEGGSVGQNLEIKTKNQREGGTRGAVIDASVGIFFVSVHC